MLRTRAGRHVTRGVGGPHSGCSERKKKRNSGTGDDVEPAAAVHRAILKSKEQYDVEGCGMKPGGRSASRLRDPNEYLNI